MTQCPLTHPHTDTHTHSLYRWWHLRSVLLWTCSSVSCVHFRWPLSKITDNYSQPIYTHTVLPHPPTFYPNLTCLAPSNYWTLLFTLLSSNSVSLFALSILITSSSKIIQATVYTWSILFGNLSLLSSTPHHCIFILFFSNHYHYLRLKCCNRYTITFLSLPANTLPTPHLLLLNRLVSTHTGQYRNHQHNWQA